MHELGICDALLKKVDEIVKNEEADGVSRVTVEVGLLSGVIPRYLTDCWQAVIDGTKYADTALKVDTVPGIALCIDCGAEFEADLNKLICPACGGKKLTPLSGRDLTIKEIEIF